MEIVTGQQGGDAEVAFGLAEYDQLKSEQHGRIAQRDGLTYTTLAAMAAVVAGTISVHSTAVLLLLPPVAIVLGWKYLAADEKISGIGRYIRDELAPRLSARTGVAAGKVFGWEFAHRNGVYAPVRRFVQVTADLLTFCAPPAAALLGFWVLGPRSTWLVVASVIEALLVLGLGWLVWIATLNRTSRGPSAPQQNEIKEGQ